MAFQLLVVSHQDLTSNCHQTDKFEFEIIVGKLFKKALYKNEHNQE